MTQTLPGADVHGYYTALGIHIPQWAQSEASVRCFADPTAHQRDDRNPSCSINLLHGAWHCHGCGAHGGPFDAATAAGHSSRSAIELMITHGLTVRRRSSDGRAHVVQARRPIPRPAPARGPASLAIAESTLRRWEIALAGDHRLMGRLASERGWTPEAVSELGVGTHRGQVTIPVRDDARRLTGVLFYRPWPRDGQPKLRAAAGSRRQLLPHPASERSRRVVLVEGEPDMIAARSHGLPAIALPGVASWRQEWRELLRGREVVVVMDADPAGRDAAQRIADDLRGHAAATIVDLAPDRTDGYDLTDWLREHGPMSRPAMTANTKKVRLALTRADAAASLGMSVRHVHHARAPARRPGTRSG
jgi:putative DNA primase/helicase